MRTVSIDELTPQDIASICDHTFLDRSESYASWTKTRGISAPALRDDAFRNFIKDTKYGDLKPYAVCVRPEDVPYARRELGNDAIIASVVGFPDGSHYKTLLKIFETQYAGEAGANEIDMVLNYKSFKQGGAARKAAENDVIKVTQQGHEYEMIVKLILETSELSNDQIEEACSFANDCGVDFVKTSTGFGKYGARAEHVTLMRGKFLGGIKISGGVTPANVRGLLHAACGQYVHLDPREIRIGESSLLSKLGQNTVD